MVYFEEVGSVPGRDCARRVRRRRVALRWRRGVPGRPSGEMAEPTLDLSLLGFSDLADLEDAGGESWERRAAPVPANSPAPAPAPASALGLVAEASASQVPAAVQEVTAVDEAPVVVAAAESAPTAVRPESATSAWIEHCRQLEEQLSRNSSSAAAAAAATTTSTESSDGAASGESATEQPQPQQQKQPAPLPPPPSPSQPKPPATPTPASAAPDSNPYPYPCPYTAPPTPAAVAAAAAEAEAAQTMTLQAILDELAGLYDRAGRGLSYDEARLELLVRLQEGNAEYREQVAAEQEAWRRSVDPFLCESLLRMRSYIPPDIFSTTLDALLLLGLTPELAKRVLAKKCLWLTRMGPDDIARLHEADLNGRFNTQGEGLDLVELAAIYASLPERFVNDRLGKKVEWRDAVERTLREWLGSEESEGCVPEGRARHEMYEAFLDDTGPCGDTSSVREVDVVSSAGSAGPRNSFQEVCKRHSILSLRRRSLTSESNSSVLSDADTSGLSLSP